MHTPEQLIDGLLDHMLYLSIAHHVAGRIRVKANWNGAQKLGTINEGQLTGIVASIPGILDYRVNKKALSLVIHYDADVLPPPLWEELASVGQYPGKRDQVRRQLLTLLANDPERFRSPAAPQSITSAEA